MGPSNIVLTVSESNMLRTTALKQMDKLKQIFILYS